MKKPKELTKEQWAKYKGDLDLSLNVMNKALDLVADTNFNAGELVERKRIIALLERDLDVLPEFARAIELIKGEQK